MSTLPPMPKQPHELTQDPALGEISGAINSVVCDHYMLQVPSESRASWLRRMIRDANAVAAIAQKMLEAQ